MHIFVQTLTGQACTVEMNNNSVDNVFAQVETQMGIPSSEQKLIFHGKKLEAGTALEEYGIVDYSNIYLVIKLEGGVKGKKKKKDTKKGKKKHKKKKVKLQILKYYKAEDGKIVRLKQMCKVCPPGTFIAEHPDRLYCGRCHTAYTKVADTSKPSKGGLSGAQAEKGGKAGKKK